jgi:hypothetical protein
VSQRPDMRLAPISVLQSSSEGSLDRPVRPSLLCRDLIVVRLRADPRACPARSEWMRQCLGGLSPRPRCERRGLTVPVCDPHRGLVGMLPRSSRRSILCFPAPGWSRWRESPWRAERAARRLVSCEMGGCEVPAGGGIRGGSDVGRHHTIVRHLATKNRPRLTRWYNQHVRITGNSEANATCNAKLISM